MNVPLLTARGLGKRYATGQSRNLASVLRRKEGPREVWSLRDVDLDVQPGEVVSVIGRNGAGKSTLLKLCAGVTRQTAGTLAAPSRIAPLIEVGAGFHPELSGRENVEVNARLLGLTAPEVVARFDEIVSFAELEKSIDMPVRQYSSGMFMRLGFSVAVHTQPELLIVDEVLAVGDLPFQVRCMDRIRAMTKEGVGVLFVSHNLGAVLNLSDRAVFLEAGLVRAQGATADVVGAYHQSLGESAGGTEITGDATPHGIWDLVSVSVTDSNGAEMPLWQPGQSAVVTMELRAAAVTPRGIVGIGLNRDAQQISRWMATDGPYVPPMTAGATTRLRLSLNLNVTEGSYILDVGVFPDDPGTSLRFFPAVHRFDVAPRPGASGSVDLAPALDLKR